MIDLDKIHELPPSYRVAINEMVGRAMGMSCAVCSAEGVDTPWGEGSATRLMSIADVALSLHTPRRDLGGRLYAVHVCAAHNPELAATEDERVGRDRDVHQAIIILNDRWEHERGEVNPGRN